MKRAIAAAAAALAIAGLAACSGSSGTTATTATTTTPAVSFGACKAAVRAGYVTAGRKDAQGINPAACAGLPDSTLAKIVHEVVNGK